MEECSLGARPTPLTTPYAIFFATGVTVCGILPMFLVGAVFVQMRQDLGLSAANLGIVLTTFLVTGGLLSVPAGRLINRIGATAGARLSVTLSAIAALGIGMTARSFGTLASWVLVAGVGNAVSHPAINLFLSRAVPADRHGVAFGVRQAALPLGSLLGGLAVPVIALTIGWRWAFIGMIVPAVLLSMWAPRLPHSSGNCGGDGAGQLTAVERRTVILLTYAMAIGFACHTNLGAFTVSSAVDAGIPEGSAGILLAGGSIVAVVVRVLVGTMADRRAGGHLQWVALMLYVGAIGYFLIAAGTLSTIILGTALTFGLAWGWPGLFILAVVQRFPHAVGTTTGILQTGGFLGAATGPLLFGLSAEHLSFSFAWAAIGVATIVAATSILATARALGRWP